MPFSLCFSLNMFSISHICWLLCLNILQSERLKQVLEYLNTLHSLCKVLGIDFKQTVSDVHPSLDEDEVPRNISNTIIERLALAIQRLREIKIERMQKVRSNNSSLEVSFYDSFQALTLLALAASRSFIYNARTLEPYGYTVRRAAGVPECNMQYCCFRIWNNRGQHPFHWLPELCKSLGCLQKFLFIFSILYSFYSLVS